MISGNPSNKDFGSGRRVASAISEGRANNRQQLRHSLDRMLRLTEAAAEDPAVSFDQYYAQGLDLVTSPKAQAAFDISKESDKVRELYGRTDFGQRLLLARRLVEVGVSFVTCYFGGWDHHTDIFKSLKEKHMPKFDQGVAGLIADLDERGLLESTLVVALGEFGRTPKVNKDTGRDHWPHAMSVLLAGAGIPRGQVVGATDIKGYHASENVHSPEDFAASSLCKDGNRPANGLAHEHRTARSTREWRPPDQRTVRLRLMSVVAMGGSFDELGRDGFHSVPDISRPAERISGTRWNASLPGSLDYLFPAGGRRGSTISLSVWRKSRAVAAQCMD